ncbi:MAG TPA: ABC transporter permease [Baekduia sp.]|nr:ABC transporter permease [Baekduia sp.]
MRGRLRRPRLTYTRQGLVGSLLLAIVVLIALLGPLLAPHDPNAPLGAPGAPPGSGAPLGLDYLGRDVLSRVLHGGVTVLGLGAAATVLSYLLGLTVGLTAGYSRSLIDPLLMRSMDLLLAFPALLVLLLLVAGLGTSVPVLLLGVLLVQLPGIARLVRTATLEVSTRGYVEAAIARGERAPSVLTREILRNIAPTVLADFGVRFGYSIIAIASMNFLSLGLQPPTSDWGLMISENRQFIGINAWAVLAPAILLAVLTISVNLVADAYSRTLGQRAPVASGGAPSPLPVAAPTELIGGDGGKFVVPDPAGPAAPGTV